MKTKLFKVAVLGAFVSATSTGIAQSDMTEVLPNAKAGECYAQVKIPAQYRTETSSVVVKEAGEQLRIIPAKYETVEERVLVSEAGSELKVIPATFGTETSTYEVSPASTRWVMGSNSSSIGADSQLVAMARSAGASVDSARPGQCFSEHFSPESYKTVTERVLVSEASEKIKLTPAKYEWEEQRVMVAPASRKLVEVPARYENKSERIMVEDAKTVWRKGRGAVEKIDHGTGDVMCLVEVPAVYKTISKRVLAVPATTKVIEQPARYETVRVRKLVADAQESRVAVPATYKNVTKRVMESGGAHTWISKGDRSAAGKATGNVICLQDTPAKMASVTRKVVKTPASVRRVEIPARYETKRVSRLLEDAREVRTAIPAVTDTVSRRVKTVDERLEWRTVICEINVTGNLMQNVQRALQKAGYNPGPIDGVIGSQTRSALGQFQRAKGLAVGGLTTETLKRLGVEQ